MTYFKLRNDMSIATLTRIVNAVYDIANVLEITLIPEVKAKDVLDARLYIFPPENREMMHQIEDMISNRVSLPIHALTLLEED